MENIKADKEIHPPQRERVPGEIIPPKQPPKPSKERKVISD